MKAVKSAGKKAARAEKGVSEEIEEYLEAMYRQKETGEGMRTNELARNLGVKPASVSEMLRKLQKKGFVSYSPYGGTSLTEKGERIGRRITRKHRLVERFLEFIGIRRGVHSEACVLEHAISDKVEKEIRKIIKEAGEMPLSELKRGQEANVIGIKTCGKARRRLMDMGLTKGTRILLKRSALFRGPVEIRARGANLAIGRMLASKIFVKLVR